MNRRNLLKGFVAGVSGLLLPREIGAEHEPIQRYWSLDRTMLQPQEQTLWIEPSTIHVSFVPDPQLFPGHNSHQLMLAGHVRGVKNGLWKSVRLLSGQTIDVDGVSFGFDADSDGRDFRYGFRQADGEIKGVRHRYPGNGSMMNAWDFPGVGAARISEEFGTAWQITEPRTYT